MNKRYFDDFNFVFENLDKKLIPGAQLGGTSFSLFLGLGSDTNDKMAKIWLSLAAMAFKMSENPSESIIKLIKYLSSRYISFNQILQFFKYIISEN